MNTYPLEGKLQCYKLVLDDCEHFYLAAENPRELLMLIATKCTGLDVTECLQECRTFAVHLIEGKELENTKIHLDEEGSCRSLRELTALCDGPELLGSSLF